MATAPPVAVKVVARDQCKELCVHPKDPNIEGTLLLLFNLDTHQWRVGKCESLLTSEGVTGAPTFEWLQNKGLIMVVFEARGLLAAPAALPTPCSMKHDKPAVSKCLMITSDAGNLGQRSKGNARESQEGVCLGKH